MYVICNTAGEVVYVGRTSNYLQRQRAHQVYKNPKTGEVTYPMSAYIMYPIVTNLSLKEARTMEQTLITAYTLDSLNNAINSIAEKNWEQFANEAYKMAKFINEHLTTAISP